MFNSLHGVLPLIDYLRTGDTSHLPAMEILAVDNSKTSLRLVIGFIIWDGQTFPKDVDTTLGKVFTNPFDMLAVRTTGGLWEYDKDILRAHGMEYCALLIEADETSTKVQQFIYRNEELSLRPFDSASVYSAIDFVSANVEYMQNLLDWFTYHVYEL